MLSTQRDIVFRVPCPCRACCGRVRGCGRVICSQWAVCFGSVSCCCPAGVPFDCLHFASYLHVLLLFSICFHGVFAFLKISNVFMFLCVHFSILKFSQFLEFFNLFPHLNTLCFVHLHVFIFSSFSIAGD